MRKLSHVYKGKHLLDDPVWWNRLHQDTVQGFTSLWLYVHISTTLIIALLTHIAVLLITEPTPFLRRVESETTFPPPKDLNDCIIVALSSIRTCEEPDINLVGSLLTRHFYDLARTYTGAHFTALFQQMLLSVLVFHAVDAYHHATNQQRSHSDLVKAFYSAGRDILARLDGMLSPRSLPRQSKERLQVLLLISLGISLAVKYSVPVSTDSFNNYEVTRGAQITLQDAMKEHICRMLSYHSALIASTIGLEFAPNSDSILSRIAPSLRRPLWRIESSIICYLYYDL